MDIFWNFTFYWFTSKFCEASIILLLKKIIPPTILIFFTFELSTYHARALLFNATICHWTPLLWICENNIKISLTK